MRIAQVPPLYEAVPPRFYGGTERVVSHLTDALVDLGFSQFRVRHHGDIARIELPPDDLLAPD